MESGQMKPLYPTGYKSIVFALSLLLSGCDVTKMWEDFYYHGTNIGFKACLESNKNSEISEDVIRKLCIDKHQKPVYVFKDGTAGYQKSAYVKSNEYNYFSGHIENKSKNIIITSFEVISTHKDNKDETGNVKNEIWRQDYVWVEPEKAYTFEFWNLQFRPEKIRGEDEKPLFTWNFGEINGLEIRLK
jgi:hypothetical protein